MNTVYELTPLAQAKKVLLRAKISGWPSRVVAEFPFIGYDYENAEEKAMERAEQVKTLLEKNDVDIY